MIRAANAAVLNVAILQRRAPVRAMKAEQSQFALGITEQHKFFAQNFDGLRNIVEVLHRAHHNPVTAKPFTPWRPWADMRDVCNRNFSALCFFGGFHSYITSAKRLFVQGFQGSKVQGFRINSNFTMLRRMCATLNALSGNN